MNAEFPKSGFPWQILLVLLLATAHAGAELTLPHIISENMMLQRDQPARIWGRGDDGTKVTVMFKQQVRATVVENGEWTITLAPEMAGGPFEMIIQHGGESLTIRNILVGEVWQASGQSNMQWTVMAETHKEEALGFPPNDQIRLFKQDRQVAAEPLFNTLPARWMPDNTGSRRHFSAVAYYFARELQAALGVPVGITLACDGGTKAQFWTPLEAFRTKPEFRATLAEAIGAREDFAQLETKFEADKAEYFRKRNAGEKAGAHPAFYGRVPCAYYNGMIHPIRNHTIRGVIWYQGERNSMTTQDAFEYRRYFPLMIEAWREAFGQPELPFFFVQLPKLSPRDVRDAAPTRESQMWTAKNVEHTGMVVTLDVGEAGLHPKLKRPIGQRLAKFAQANVYGQDVEHASPLYRSAKVDGSQILLEFDQVGKGLKSNDGKPLREFTLCGADHKFVAATAKLVGTTVIVSSPQVGRPVAVRYAWKNDPMVNLFGQNGLPVGPFRTDSFELQSRNQHVCEKTHPLGSLCFCGFRLRSETSWRCIEGQAGTDFPQRSPHLHRRHGLRRHRSVWVRAVHASSRSDGGGRDEADRFLCEFLRLHAFARGVEMLFHPGTHDMVAFDLAWGGAHHPDIPDYLGANTRHGKRGHPKLERDQANKAAFLLRHFLPVAIHLRYAPLSNCSSMTGEPPRVLSQLVFTIALSPFFDEALWPRETILNLFNSFARIASFRFAGGAQGRVALH